jgi:hypothetical protein
MRVVGVKRTVGSAPCAARRRTVKIDTDSRSATSRAVSSCFGTLAVPATRLASAGKRDTLLGVEAPRPEPFFVKPDQTDFTFTCPDCVHEKNSPLHPERPPFGTGSLADEEVQFGGSLPLDKDADWFTCIHGHRQFVVRRGTEQAARLGG